MSTKLEVLFLLSVIVVCFSSNYILVYWMSYMSFLGTVQYLSEYWAGANIFSSSKYLLTQQGQQEKKVHAQSNDNVKKLIAQHNIMVRTTMQIR